MNQPDQELSSLFRRRFPELESADAVRLGRFLPGSAPELALDLANEIARLRGLPTFGEFQRMHEASPVTGKPHKPSTAEIEDRLWRNPPPVKNTKELRFFRFALERLAHKEYSKSLSDHEQEQRAKESFRKDFPPDMGGYLAFLGAQDPSVSRFFFERYRMLPISEEDRKRHTYIVGGSGSGKSELIKWFLHHYVTRHPRTAVVLIEPHGPISKQVARWKELADGKRLVYIQPGMSTEVTPVFNPFDISDEERHNPKTLAILVDDTIDVVAELLDKDFSLYMETLMRACLTILFHRPGSTFADILRFVDLDNNADLIETGRRIFAADSPLLSFVLRDLPSDTMRPTRQAVKMRFIALLSRYSFSSFLIGKSTVNLEELIKRRAFIVFNFSASDIGKAESRIFGKLILSHLKAFGFKQGRDDAPRHTIVPVHVFIDECQAFITPSLGVILEELRKFGIHLTIVQQGIGQEMGRELTEAVLTNTAVKITGRNSEENLHKFAKQTGADPKELERLQAGKGLFCISAGGRKPVIIRIPGHRIDDRGSTTEEVWQATLAEQIARYYTPRKPIRTIETAPDEGGHSVGSPRKGFAPKELVAADGKLSLPIDT